MLVELAKILDDATLAAREIERLTASHPDLTLEDAYRIQDEGIKLRVERGERVVGLKMGFTSEAKRTQMGLGSPIYGVLTESMRVRAGEELHLAGSIHPKIEPEIVFIMARELRGRPTIDEALAACESVCVGMEILDSRFKGFKYFSLPDVIADNCSSSRFVLSEQRHDPRAFDLASLTMDLEVDGSVVQSALSSAISGHPARSLVQLCELLAPRGLAIPAGSIVLAGAATQAVALEPGVRVRTVVERLGEVSVSVSVSSGSD